MTHVHKIHNRRKKFQYSYLKQFIEEDQKLLAEEEALFAGAELRWNGVEGGKKEEEDLVEDSVEDSVENSVENPVEDSVEDSVENFVEDFVEDSVEDSLKKKDSIIIKDDSKKEPKNSEDLADDKEEEEEGEDDGSYAFLLAKYHRLKRQFPFPCRLGRGTKDYQGFCELRFAKDGDRRDHEREHLGVRPFQCLWPKKSRTGDKEEKKTEDDFCGRHFLRRQFAREHIKDEHGFGELDEDELDQFINVQEHLLHA